MYDTMFLINLYGTLSKYFPFKFYFWWVCDVADGGRTVTHAYKRNREVCCENWKNTDEIEQRDVVLRICRRQPAMTASGNSERAIEIEMRAVDGLSECGTRMSLREEKNEAESSPAVGWFFLP